jgi:hypothetical protein
MTILNTENKNNEHTNNTRTNNKKQAKHNEQCQAYESLQIQEEKQEARNNNNKAEEQRTKPKRTLKNK